MATCGPPQRRVPPLVKRHATERFDERACHPEHLDVDPWTAWIDAHPVTLPEPWRSAGDEARYHPDSQVILCRRDSAITTVYDVVGNDAHPVVRRAVEQQFDISIEGVSE